MPSLESDRDNAMSNADPIIDASRILVSCPTSFVAVLERIGTALHACRPGFALAFSGANRTIDLSRGDADIALRMFPGNDPHLVCLRSVDLGWGAYASRAYLADHGAPATIEAFATHRLVLYGASLHRVPGPRWIEERCIATTEATRVQNPEVAGQVIAAGEGIGVIPCIAASRYGELVRIIPTPVATQATWIVYDQQAARDLGRVRGAAEALRELMAAHADEFAGQAP